MIPPSGPSPGQRSVMDLAPNCEYFSGEPMIITEGVTPRITTQSRASKTSSPICTSALSRPKRVLPPPASTKPPTLAADSSRVTGHPRQPALAPAAEYPARVISPASFGGAARWKPPCAKRSSGGSPTASSGTQPRICAWLRESLFRPDPHRFRSRSSDLQSPAPSPLLPEDRLRRSPRRGTRPESAPTHSSTPARFRANRNAQSPPMLRGPVAPYAPIASHAFAETPPPSREYLLYVRAKAATPR